MNDHEKAIVSHDSSNENLAAATGLLDPDAGKSPEERAKIVNTRPLSNHFDGARLTLNAGPATRSPAGLDPDTLGASHGDRTMFRSN